MLNPHTLVVVADGTSAVLWQTQGRGTGLQMIETMEFEAVVDDGPSGTTPPEQSVKDTQEATFIKHLVNRLNSMALKNEIQGDVVIVADPTSLGQMRPQFHTELSRRIVRELAKSLVKAPKDQLEAALA